MALREKTDAPVTLRDSKLEDMSANERLKLESRGLFFVAEKSGAHAFRAELDALAEGEPTISGTAKELSKFFGIYKQQGRGERGKKTHDYFFMVRIRLPAGGRLSPAQWAALDDAADRFADGTLRITSRQGIQYHHVYGPSLAPAGAAPEPPLPRRGDARRLRRREPQRDDLARRRPRPALRPARDGARRGDRRAPRAAELGATSRRSCATTRERSSRR